MSYGTYDYVTKYTYSVLTLYFRRYSLRQVRKSAPPPNHHRSVYPLTIRQQDCERRGGVCDMKVVSEKARDDSCGLLGVDESIRINHSCT